MSTVLIFGARGFIGSQIKALYKGSKEGDCDIADREAVKTILEKVKPAVVINAAGKTGVPNVDWCEDHKVETVHSNVTGPLILMEECMKRGIFMAHLGSGCIFDGPADKIFTEDDEPNFSGSFYSFTKLTTDRLLAHFPVLQVRPRMPFEASLEPRNLITKLKGYKKVLDQQNSITYLPDFLQALQKLIDKRKTGVYNIVNPGTISPYQIMEKYKQIVDPSHTFDSLSLDHLSDVVKAGRSNCVLSSDKLKKEGIMMMSVEEAVEEAMRVLAKK